MVANINSRHILYTQSNLDVSTRDLALVFSLAWQNFFQKDQFWCIFLFLTKWIRKNKTDSRIQLRLPGIGFYESFWKVGFSGFESESGFGVGQPLVPASTRFVLKVCECHGPIFSPFKFPFHDNSGTGFKISKFAREVWI